MKKLSAFILAMIMSFALVGCETFSQSDKEASAVKVYSFSGQNEVCSVINGVAVIEPGFETMYGGMFRVDEGAFEDMTSYSMTFYISADGENNPILSHSVRYTTGSFELHHQEIGRITGDVFSDSEAAALKQNLYFELETTDKDGKTQKHIIPMEVKEITGT